MKNSLEIARAVAEAELRRQFFATALTHTEAAQAAEAAALQAEATADRSRVEADQRATEAAQAADPAEQARLQEAAASQRGIADEHARLAAQARRQAQQTRTMADLYQERMACLADESVGAQARRLLSALRSLSTWVWIGVFASLSYLFYHVCAKPQILEVLGQDTNGRGLITLLIVGATVVLALMLVYQAYAPTTTNENFRMAREVFGSLVGIVGTIVGFYFGAAHDLNSPSAPPLEVRTEATASEIRVSAPAAQLPMFWALQKENGEILAPPTRADSNSVAIPVQPTWVGQSIAAEVSDQSGREGTSNLVTVPPAAP